MICAMQKYRIPYGHDALALEIPSNLEVKVITQGNPVAHSNPAKAVEEALSNPCGGTQIENFPVPQSVAIAINDKTRPVPHHILLPPLLHRLRQMGVVQSGIKFIIASGTHTPMRPDEFPLTLPKDLIADHEVIVHDCTQNMDLVELGTTSSGTPVVVNRDFYEAELKIVIGNIEPHHFMGFSGGVKSAAIGLAGLETIRRNHAMITHPQARLGEYQDNPMRQDVEEIGKIIGVDYAVNAILNENLDIVHVLAGNPQDVMKTGIPLSRKVCQVPVDNEFDIVIASCGGYPKDINLYQSQKGQSNAATLVKTGGVIILVAECSEGIGSSGYEHFICGVDSHQEVMRKFRGQDFELGPHKAFLFSRIAEKCETILVSNIPDEVVRRHLHTPAPDLQTAFQLALDRMPNYANIALMPHAVATVPYIPAFSGN